jgi:flagellar basal body-associated protein FliL
MAFGQPQKENPGISQKMEPYDMHVMPPKFHQYLAVKSQSSPSKILMVIAIIVFVLIMLGIGGYFLYLQMNLPGQNINTANLNEQAVSNANLNLENENLNMENINAEENDNANDNANMANENFNASVNANENINVNLNENVNAGINVNGNANTNAPVELINYSGSLDSDADKLTDVEEDLYQIERRTPDTDGDGYLDGDEIISGYNPKVAGGAKLETSGLVNQYSNPVFNYEVLYPTSWLARPEDQSLQVVLFMTSTEEFMKISVEDNAEKLDLVNWYLRLSPGADLNLLEKKTTAKGYDALVSPDKLTYYILDPNTQDKVYVLTYNIGSLSQINFLSTFQMMVNSFTVSKATP